VGKGRPVLFHLSKWRPGRYELQRFDRNISDVLVRFPDGHKYSPERLTTHSWEVDVTEGAEFIFEYTYYAHQLDAGGSFYDSDFIYVNGINMLMYTLEDLDEPCELLLNIPEDYQIACGLPREGNMFFAKDYHQVVDAPLLASRDLLHYEFEASGIPTHFWFQGPCAPDRKRLEEDVRRYTQKQLEVFGDFPVESYHYLCVMRPDKFRHGVEHFNSTVITMGPGFRFNDPDFYRSFIEICSHEFFHTWNVKALRPADMFPYDYGGENYSRLHFITEGVTTYYGDLMIWKGGGWDTQSWLQSLNGEIRRFYQMGGKSSVSLDQASLESWINGYNQTGTPNRRISFYTKGYLVAFLLDVEIRKATGNEHSLDEVMRLMYQRIAKAGRGYTREDYKGIAEELSGLDLDTFFEDYISGVRDLEDALQIAGEYMGFELRQRTHPNTLTSYFGIEWVERENGRIFVSNLYPDSPGLTAGLSKGDELVSLNGWKVKTNVEEVLNFVDRTKPIEVHFFHQEKLRKSYMKSGNKFLRYIPQFFDISHPTDEQLQNRREWQKVRTEIQVKG
ncbi:PDZ domain-containing protein, partial [bacterium]|nr:PDZ domain-containing protein [bacterium]